MYRCDRPNLQLGLDRCLGFGGTRVDAAIAQEVLRVVEPMAIEASIEAERMLNDGLRERARVAELDLEQARQVVPGAPWQIRVADLQAENVVRALANRRRRSPRRLSGQDQMSMFSDS